MSTETIPRATRISFEVPGGELRFADGDLDTWAEHLAWCYRLLGIADGATIAVQDFGTSPLAYLGSSLLMPTLEAGIAERLNARVICLDASAERVVLTPEVIRQVDPDVLIVRADVLGLLLDAAKRACIDLTALGGLTIVAALGAQPVPRAPGRWRRLLHDPPSLLLAPECVHCGCFHLRAGVYSLADGRVENLLQRSAVSCVLPRRHVVDEPCGLGVGDVLFRLVDPGERARP